MLVGELDKHRWMDEFSASTSCRSTKSFRMAWWSLVLSPLLRAVRSGAINSPTPRPMLG